MNQPMRAAKQGLTLVCKDTECPFLSRDNWRWPAAARLPSAAVLQSCCRRHAPSMVLDHSKPLS